MKEFLLVFRNEQQNMPAMRSPEEMQDLMKQWMDWIGGIAAQDKLVSRGNRLAMDGKVLRAGNVVTDGPYAELKEIVGGYVMVRAVSYDDAIDLAKGCPIFSIGGNIEIRQVIEA